MHMIVLVLVSALLPSMIILVIILWGWRHGTLRATPQERNDWEFERIVRRI